MAVPPPSPRLISPLATWLAGEAALARFRRERLGRAPAVLRPRDRAWRAVAPGFPVALEMARRGQPFQVVLDRRTDPSADPRRLRRALAAGAAVFFPQVHQVLPRLARLMVALRASLLGPFREECSFLFAVDGRGRPGMGLHHDGDVDSFWLQLQGRRTVTIGPPVSRGTPEDLPEDLDRRAAGPGRAPGSRRGWWTGDLPPGTLFYLPPRTPHRVVCHGRSLALSLTWHTAARPPKSRAPDPARRAAVKVHDLVAWDVVSGRVDAIPPLSRDRLWTQLPVVAGPVDRARREFPLWTPDGALRLPAALRPLASRLAAMPSLHRPRTQAAAVRLTPLLEHGILAPRDLPLRILPDDPAALDGWRFA